MHAWEFHAHTHTPAHTNLCAQEHPDDLPDIIEEHVQPVSTEEAMKYYFDGKVTLLTFVKHTHTHFKPGIQLLRTVVLLKVTLTPQHLRCTVVSFTPHLSPPGAHPGDNPAGLCQ